MNIYSYECGSRLCVPLPWPNPASFVKTRLIDIMTGCRANVGHRRHIDGGKLNVELRPTGGKSVIVAIAFFVPMLPCPHYCHYLHTITIMDNHNGASHPFLHVLVIQDASRSRPGQEMKGADFSDKYMLLVTLSWCDWLVRVPTSARRLTFTRRRFLCDSTTGRSSSALTFRIFKRLLKLQEFPRNFEHRFKNSYLFLAERLLSIFLTQRAFLKLRTVIVKPLFVFFGSLHKKIV